MAATAIAASTRYRALGNLHIVFIPTSADYTSVTRAEINAGTDLTGEVAEWAGFTTTSEKIDTPDLKSSFVSSIPGSQTAEDSSITMYASSAGTAIQSLLPRDTTGFILMMDSGDVPTKKMDVYPVQVASLVKVRALDAATMIRADLNVTRVPSENQTIPA